MLTFKLKACFGFKVLNCLTAYNKPSPSCHSTNGGSDGEIGPGPCSSQAAFVLGLLWHRASCVFYTSLHFVHPCMTNTCQTKTKQIYNPLT